jgi:hypothetical protein
VQVESGDVRWTCMALESCKQRAWIGTLNCSTHIVKQIVVVTARCEIVATAYIVDNGDAGKMQLVHLHTLHTFSCGSPSTCAASSSIP